MGPARGRFSKLWLLAAGAVLTACASPAPVELPPRVDLYEMGRIGLLEVRSEGPDALRVMATQRLVEALQSAQPGVPILELGPAERVLAVLGRDALDPEAVRALGRRYEVDTLLVGELEIREARPKLAVGGASLSARAEIEGSLRLRLLDAESGATLWSGSAEGGENVAHLSLAAHRLPDFGASAPEDARQQLVDGLVAGVTRDFHPSYAQR